MDLDNDELCLIDAAIKSLRDVPLKPSLTTLNLHSNQIRTIENLHHLTRLTHLDLSSNRIQLMQGFDRLVSLRTLNLSCNFIQVVDGLQNLRLVQLSFVRPTFIYMNSVYDIALQCASDTYDYSTCNSV